MNDAQNAEPSTGALAAGNSAEEHTTPEVPLLTVYNAHVPACGEPPSIVSRPEDSTYYGYFVNEYGEQWIFEYDDATQTATLRGGDAGWEQKYVVDEGSVDFCQIILTKSELMWSYACWMVATAKQRLREGRSVNEPIDVLIARAQRRRKKRKGRDASAQD